MSKILIIEDEDTIAELEKDYLELSGFSVEWVSDGQEGLKRALEEEFDLFILDVMLPTMDGFAVCREIRAKTNVPILMVSARKEDIDKIRGLGLGADDYITKPFSPSELVARVKAHLTRYDRIVESVRPRENVFEARGLRIDFNTKKVSVDGEEKLLTAKEYELLTYFVEHPNRICTKEEIFREIWNSYSIGEIQTVTVHVKKLRIKLEEQDEPRYIETIWGMGYRFIV